MDGCDVWGLSCLRSARGSLWAFTSCSNQRIPPLVPVVCPVIGFCMDLKVNLGGFCGVVVKVVSGEPIALIDCLSGAIALFWSLEDVLALFSWIHHYPTTPCLIVLGTH